MRLSSVTRVKNDGDIIEEFVRHTARLVDSLVVVDNASLDSTRDVLSALQAEGLPVTVLLDDHIGVYDWIMTDLTRTTLVDSDADYCLVLDADEFVRVPSRAALEQSLAALPPGSHARVPMISYVPRPDDDSAEIRTLARVAHRLRTELQPFNKAFVSRSFLSCPEATVRIGNHGVDDPQQRFGNIRLPGVELAHFPVRSLAQIQNKGFLGWSAILTTGYEGGGLAYQWQRIFERLAAGGLSSSSEFYECALGYYLFDLSRGLEPELVYDPLPPVERRYPLPVPELTQTALAYIRQLAQAYATLRCENERLRAQLDD
jgi:hypothetical protein